MTFVKICYNVDIDYLLFFCKFVSIIILFQKALQFKNVAMLCYSRRSLVRMTTKVPPLLGWHICQIIIDCFSHVIIACVLNQSKEHQLLNDALHSGISMSLKLIEELKFAPSFQTLMEKDFGVALELICLATLKRRFVEFQIVFFPS